MTPHKRPVGGGVRRDGTRRAVTIIQALSLGCSLGLGAWMLQTNLHFYHDDAYITLRYARNLLAGLGPVWNPGEHVQGYTNFLQLLLVSALGGLGFDLVWASRAVGIASLIALILALLFLGPMVGRDPRFRAFQHLPVVIVLSSAPLIVWAIGGLEGALFSLLTAVGCLLFTAGLDRPTDSRVFAAAGLSLALGMLARPDGAVFVGVSLLWLVVTWKSRPLRTALAFAVPCLAIVAAQACWQLAFYGDAAPNTFYAKFGGLSQLRVSMGLVYLRTYALEPPYLPLLVPATAIVLILARRWRDDRRVTYLAMTAVAYALFVVSLGGDYMPAFRLLIPLIVPLATMLCLMLSSLLHDPKPLAVALTTLVVLVLSALQLRSEIVNPRVEDPAAFVGTIVGKYAEWAWPAGTLIALNTAGSTPYYAPRQRFIDMLGLNDSHIARRRIEKVEVGWQTIPGHLKGDGAYVLSRSPDIIILGPAEGTTTDAPRSPSSWAPWFLSDLEIARDPRFEKPYELEQVRIGRHGQLVERNGLVLTYYRRIATMRG